ncbi:MAG: cyclic nucleotide-binding domain-containing protein [Bacteroidetes bacterium]|nr:MAG: cyclic nucleotide-binding domain-containing protein [Bacteroidota bacterium]
MIHSHISLKQCVQLLQQVELFRHVPENVIEALARKMILAGYPADATIIKKGDAGNSMFVILEGKVKIHEGEHMLAEMAAKQFFGELSILDSEPRSMSVTALESTTLGLIHQADVYQVLKDHPDAVRDIIGVLSHRLRNQNQTIISQLKERGAELEKLVNEKTKDLVEKNTELSSLLLELRRTQEQLITQEKLATLGHLTAGIAHEIQNPLNFITNFSSLSVELIDEFNQSTDEAERREILTDLSSNIQKIYEHGFRADSIVKNMMLHSRARVIEKTETDINKLISDYMELAYHGVQVKDPNFNCKIEVSLDKNIQAIALHRQNISRVILNLLGNAFYTVNKRSKLAERDYSPFVRISSIKEPEMLRIEIEDNGEGIASTEMEKIFQPFFTTKRIGEGTGLGLSLSHDIITKEHGGSMTVKSQSGVGTTFTIRIPFNV